MAELARQLEVQSFSVLDGATCTRFAGLGAATGLIGMTSMEANDMTDSIAVVLGRFRLASCVPAQETCHVGQIQQGEGGHPA